MKHRFHHSAFVWLDQATHLAVIVGSLVATFLLRFDFHVPGRFTRVLQIALCIAAAVKLPVFDWAGFHRCVRRFASVSDLYGLALGNLAASICCVAISLIWFGNAVPVS